MCEAVRQQALDAGRPSAGARGYDATWRALRADVLRRHPRCACGSKATEVDHLVAIRDGGARLDPKNLRTMCKPCHSRRTATDQGFARTPGGGSRISAARSETAPPGALAILPNPAIRQGH